MKQITVRNVTPELSKRLERLSEAHGESLNATVVRLLEKAVGIDGRRERLARYATWTGADREELESSLQLQRTIDPELWER